MTPSLAAAAALLAQALPRDVLELVWTFLAMLLASGLATSFVSTRADRRRQRDAAARADADRAFDVLHALRAACRRAGQGDPAAPGDLARADLADALETTALRASTEAGAAATRYVRAAAVFASGALDAGVEVEETAYDQLVTVLMRSRNAFR